MSNPFLYIETVLLQTIQLSMSTKIQWQKTVLLQAIQFSISTQFVFLTYR